MRDDLVKAYNIIKEEQRNADNKANLFIILITAVITFLGEVPATLFSEEQFGGIQYLFLMLLIPLMFFIISLIPIYNHKYFLRRKIVKNQTIELNIFYWKSIYYLQDDTLLCIEYKRKYNIKDLNNAEIDMLKQIRVNANIMERKSYTHKIAFYLLGQIIILTVLGALYTCILKESRILIFISFIVVQIGYYMYVFGLPSWITKLKFRHNNKKDNILKIDQIN